MGWVGVGGGREEELRDVTPTPLPPTTMLANRSSEEVRAGVEEGFKAWAAAFKAAAVEEAALGFSAVAAAVAAAAAAAAFLEAAIFSSSRYVITTLPSLGTTPTMASMGMARLV
jgi:hypothetical protein